MFRQPNSANERRLGIGDLLPGMPIFLSEDDYVSAPLEVTYMQAWAVFPAMLKDLMEVHEEGIEQKRLQRILAISLLVLAASVWLWTAFS